MADTLESTTKKYPHQEEDIKYEKEIKDAIKKLPLEQRFQAIALNNYVLMRKQIDTEVEGQIQDLVRKFNKLQAPLMQHINEIVGGKRAPTEAEVQEAKNQLPAEEVQNIAASLDSNPIEGYWFKVLTSCVKLSEDVFEADHPLLKHVTQIENIPEEQGEHFTIRLHFSPNEYMENDTLSVRFVMIDDQEFEKSEGTEIKWKEGKDITKKTVTKKQKNKKTGKTRSITKTVDADSFFNLFKSITPKNAPEGDDEDEDGEGMDEEGERLALNFNVALTIQEEIIPYHLEYYLGLRTGDEDMDDDDLDEIGEEDEDDDDDDEEEGGKPHKHGKNCAHGHGHGKKGKGGDKKEEGAGAGGQKQECKQQ